METHPHHFHLAKFVEKLIMPTKTAFPNRIKNRNDQLDLLLKTLITVRSTPEHTISQKFNTFVKASCELPNGTCFFQRQRLCSVCKKPKCKKIKHFAATSQQPLKRQFTNYHRAVTTAIHYYSITKFKFNMATSLFEFNMTTV